MELDVRGIRWPDHWDLDHICYRVGTKSRYHEMKALLSNLGELLAETDVNGRPIATFRLHQPLVHRGWRIDLVELPAPKQFKTTVEGFEHIEVVADETFNQIHRRFQGADFEHGGMSKFFNAELEMRIGARAVKFHHLSLESVVRLESNEKAWKALRASRVLEVLVDHDPQVTGTFPLGLDVVGSDLDIVFQWKDVTKTLALIQRSFGREQGFHSVLQEVAGVPTLFATFEIGGVPFELFGQDAPVLEQNAYRHFLAEERLLKYGGAAFTAKVRTARARGLKTEPAFLEALAQNGDPYLRVLELQRWSGDELRSLFE